MSSIKGKIGSKNVNEQKVRKARSDKKVRVMLSLSQENEAKLKRLAIACDMAKSTLGNEIVEWALNNEQFIDFFQRKFHASDELRVIPIKQNGKITY